MPHQNKSVVVFGDSHVASLKGGLVKLLDREEPCKEAETIDIKPFGPGGEFRKPFFKKVKSHIEIVEKKLAENIGRLPFDNEYRLYGFSGNLHTLRLMRDIGWNRHAPWEIADTEIPISKSLLFEMFNEDQNQLLSFVDALSSIGIPIFAIDAPRPFKHNPIFSGKRKKTLLFLDRAYREYINMELGKRGVPVVKIPQECIDDEGFMLDIYRHQNPIDKHHANETFGELMMERICEFVRNSNK